MTRSHAETALVFPGQGSQQPGMGTALYEKWPETRAAFDRLDDALSPDLDLHDLCFDAKAETLRATERTQPAVFAIGLATYRGLQTRTGIEPEFVTGHSLGHVTAIAASEMLAPTHGVQLVRRRGQFMA